MPDGDGWVECACGARHWGLHGAAGVVIVHPETDHVLMQLRAEWTHGGSTWAFPGGARESHESVVDAALRELAEELGVAAHEVEVLHENVWTDHGDWRYHTVIARAVADVTLSLNAESAEARWVHFDSVAELSLHPSLADVWPEVLAAIRLVASRTQ